MPIHRWKIALIFFILNVTELYALVPLQVFHSPTQVSLASRDDSTRLLANTDEHAETNNNNNNRIMGSSTFSIPAPHALNPIEAWCMIHMDLWYSESLSIKCPFFRRRMADLLDGVDMVMRFLIIRHKSLDLIGPPPGCRSSRMSKVKCRQLSIDDRLDTIRLDWKTDTHKGYYITGRLNTTIYRDDVLFDGPDPDMPVRGLRKYLNAASHLFDHSTSTAELLSLQVGVEHENTIVAKWKLQGVLHLPWHPELPIWTGQTTYHFGEDGLVHLHKESWDISVAQAFTQTLWPEMAENFWSTTSPNEQEEAVQS
jgi:hypothetical protein